MMILGRPPSRYAKRLLELPSYLFYFLRCIVLFKRPFRFIWAYISTRSVADRVVELRSGLKIHLSGHPLDIVTVFVIFARRDYGAIPPQSVVVDIGANIGVFALYAAHCKAARVLAYEPNSESFSQLQGNIAANGLQHIVKPSRLAVSSKEGATLKFPVAGSVYNAALPDDATDYELVQTTTLETILRAEPHVDVLKMDCEGAEYEIIFGTPRQAFDGVNAIRLEYHHGRLEELASTLQPSRFRRRRLRHDTPLSGTVWYERA